MKSMLFSLVSHKLQDIKNAPSKMRLQIAVKTLLLVIIILAVVKFANLFFPPKIVTSFPGNSSSQTPLDSRLEVIFDKAMIRTLVEKSFTITPEIEGTVSWEQDRKFIFTPKNNLQRATSYTVKFQGFILSKYLMPLSGQKEISFETVGHPKVILASPQNEALEESSPVTVVFDRPMVALTTATNSALKKPAFTISPAIPGEGRWLGTTAYQFRPSQRYKRATIYKVTVPANLRSQDGGTLQNDYIWEFTSERPKIEEVSPLRDYDYASPVASIAAFFNHDLDPSSIADKIILLDDKGNKVPGNTLVLEKVLGFYPKLPLARESRYQAQVKKGIKNTEGPNGLEDDVAWFFTVAAKPAVISANPVNGSKNVSEQYTVNISFKTPMDEKSFKDNVIIIPKPATKPALTFSSYNKSHSLSVNTYLSRSTQYSITIGAGVTDQYGVPLGNPYTFKFETASYKPSITFNPAGTYFGSFNQTIIPRVVAQVINSELVDYSLYKLTNLDFLDLYRRRYEEQCGSDYECRTWQNYPTSQLEKVKDWQETYQAGFNTPVHVITKVTSKNDDKLPPGYYFLDARIPTGAHDNMVMIVSKSTLTVKKSDKQIFIWSVDQSNGQVIPGMKVQLTDASGNILTSGETNKDGVFVKDVNLFQKRNLFVFGTKDDDTVVVADSFNLGISPYDFGLPSYYNPNESKDYYVRESYKLFLSLDRPIYRPGHKIYFKGVIRKDNDGAYENIAPKELVSVSITDARNRSLYQQQLPVNTFGSFWGDFTLSSDASLGYYKVSATYKGSSYNQEFQVEEFRKPDLAVEVKPSKNAYTHAENAQISISASYYFGAPVADSEVTWTQQTMDYSFRWDKDQRFEFGDPDSYWLTPWWYKPSSSYFSGKKVTEGKAITNSKGELELTLPLDITKFKTSQRMIVEATVNDESNQSIAASQEFTVHKAEIYAGLNPVSYANQSGKPSQVEVVTVDISGYEIPDIPVNLEFFKRTWESIREKNPDDGLFYYTSKPKDTSIFTTSVTTDSVGHTLASFIPPEGGTYKVVATITDDKGNQNVSGSFLWVSGYGFSTARENHDRIVLVTDKRDYLVGENLSLFVASPYASESAKTLVTFERGSVLDYKIVDTSETSNNFNFPIPSKFTPNIYIGTVLIIPGSQVKKPAEFKIGVTEVKVTDKKQQLDIKITTDKKKYKPKETLKATIETKDLLGNPVSTEIALAAVDKAVWDLSQVELADIYKTFYQPRNLEVATSELLTISIDRINANTNLGSKGGSGGGGGGGYDTSRRDFPETAYWNPKIETDKNGQASLEIQLPDNLTTWRLAAFAASTGSSFGSKVSEVTVTRDILIRPFLPRFLSIGDEAKLGAIIVNTSGETQDLTAKIDSQGLDILTDKTQNQTLADGAQTKIIWSTRAASTTSAKIKLSLSGTDNIVKDALEVQIPVKSYHIPQIVAAGGEAKDIASENIFLPSEVDPGKGNADVTFSPSLGGGSIAALPYLFDYPYYCSEQIASRLLPAVLVYRILNIAKIESTAQISSKRLSDTINDAIQRLNNQQHPDGGWGWWTEYQSDPFTTAYALDALLEAKKDNFVVAGQTLQQAQEYLERILSGNRKDINLNTRSYILYVLRESNDKLSSYAANLYDRRFELSIEARSYLAMAAKNMPGQGNRASRLINELISLGKKTATTTHWEEPKQDFTFMGGNTTATAAVLEALLLFDRKNPLIPEIIRYLMSIKKDGHWDTTRDTSMVVKAIASQLLIKGDAKVNEDYRLELNGKIIKEGKFTKDDLLKLEEYVISMTDLKIGSENNFKIQKSGSGNLYYNINLKYFLPFSEIAPLERGLVVIREFIDDKGNILPIDTLAENTEVWVRLIIVAPEERHFVVIEDVLPAGLESVNESLKNVSVLNKERPMIKNEDNKILYFEHQEYHDDRTTLFASYLPPGVYEVTYRVRATTPGRYHHPPAQAYQMYIPDIMGHSAGGWLEVKEKQINP